MLWGFLVGRPSAGKSPALAPARRMLDKLDAEARQLHESASQVHERALQIDRIEAELAMKSARKLVSRGDKGAAEAALASLTKENREAPREQRIVVNDSTVEKLGELLDANPRGIIYVRDEVAGWLANLDREAREGDRGFFLECWNGKGSYTVDRIGRGTTRIEACAVSIMGGVQPGKLGEYVRGAVRGGTADDGLIQRFQMSVFPDLPPVWRFRDFAPNPNSERDVLALFRYLYALDPAQLNAESDESCDTPYLRLSENAQDRFAAWLTALMSRIRSGSAPAPSRPTSSRISLSSRHWPDAWRSYCIWPSAAADPYPTPPWRPPLPGVPSWKPTRGASMRLSRMTASRLRTCC